MLLISFTGIWLINRPGACSPDRFETKTGQRPSGTPGLSTAGNAEHCESWNAEQLPFSINTAEMRSKNPCNPEQVLFGIYTDLISGTDGVRTHDLSRVRRTLIPAELPFRIHMIKGMKKGNLSIPFLRAEDGT